ncbi:MAG TPA: hypothetical protein VF288_01695 [Mycobacteriales bacterium]
MKRVRALLEFWYDFVVGDDWRVAGGVVVALAITVLAGRATSSVWWVLPVAVVVVLPWSLWRGVRASRTAARPGAATEQQGAGETVPLE